MSNGVYALLGVLLGGVITAGVTWWQGWRAARAEWLVATRLISDEIRQVMRDLKFLIENGKPPGYMLTGGGDTFLSTAAWDEHRAVIARGLENNPTGDQLWRGLSNVYARVRELKALMSGGTTTGLEEIRDILLDNFADAARAYEALSGVPAGVSPAAASEPAQESAEFE
jgi:hypothetical protein